MTRLIWGLAIGVLLAPTMARAQSDEVVYYHTDAVGSVRMITDATGAVVGRYDYLPFGELWPTTPAPPTDVRQYAGKERDVETGLDYFGARYYRGVSGRFTTVDPALDIEKALVDPQQWARYPYVRNNPLRFVDPDGRMLFDWADYQRNVAIASKFGQSGYGYFLPAVAGIAAVGSVAQDALMFAVGGELAALRYAPRALPLVATATTGANRAYEAARAGGPNAGTLENMAGRSLREVQNAIRGYDGQVKEHVEKLTNPAKYAEKWGEMTQQQRTGLLNKWAKDLQRNQDLADTMRGLADSMRLR